jgi:succinate-semialdehyde dehydrogenase/glutarate-semialdehyde dehydrogenase
MTVETTSTTSEETADRIVCTNPADGSTIDEIPVPDAAEVHDAVARAREAQQHWQRLPVDERADYLLDARDILLDHRRELRRLLVAETGKAQTDALAEFLTVFETFDYYAKRAPEALAERSPGLRLLKNKSVTVRRVPHGVSLNISPWNFPFDLAITPLIPSLLAGNAAIVKPSEWTPLVANRTVELMNQAGLPDGLLQSIPGYGETGAQLVDQVDVVSFTGSVETGRKVAEAAARKLIPCTLEMGGKDPCIILDDADLERAANAATFGAYFNSGQVCMSVERVYVHEALYDDFVDTVVTDTRRLRQGNPANGQVDVGAMTFPPQVEIIERHLEDAVDKGARILTGGEAVSIEGGTYFEPTVVVDVSHEMDLMREETFGPIMPIMKVSSAAEAVRLANDTPYGLNASIFSTDRERARRLARQIQSGNVCINDVIASYLAIEAPYGGMKESGVGRRKGLWELDDFSQPQTIMEDRVGLKREPFWYPYRESVVETIDRALDGLYRRGIAAKIKGLFSGSN